MPMKNNDEQKNQPMIFPIRTALLVPTILVTLLAGCVTPPAPTISRNPDELTAATMGQSGPEIATGNGAQSSAPVGPQITLGTGKVINQRAAAEPVPNLGSSGEATFNFEGESPACGGQGHPR